MPKPQGSLPVAAALAVALAGASAEPVDGGAAPARVRASIAVPDARATTATPAPAAPAAREQAPVRLTGPRRLWPALDGTRNRFYAKSFVRAAAGRRAEIWVANDLRFPSGDCRNAVDGGARVRVTRAQAQYLARQFDTVIYARQQPIFGAPNVRDGRRAKDRRYATTKRDSRVVVLVDNVRDENFGDRNNASNHPYIAGFFSYDVGEATDRNVVTVDSYDWPHRLRANPPHAPVPGDNCASAPSRPFLYEGTLAHEYQHLLQEVTDPEDREATWVDEGLADFAQTLSGYARPAARIDEHGFDSHVQCILGWLNVQTPFNPNPRQGGPENSLTRWRDEGDTEILCDYGAAFTFMHVFADRYGNRAMTRLHREQAAGLRGVQNVLEQLGAREDAYGLLHDWQATLALDAALDRGTPLRVGDVRRFTSRSLSAAVNWDNPHAYSTPGARPNAADYVRLRDAAGRYLGAAELQTVQFRSAGVRRETFALQLVGYASSDATVPATQVTVPVVGGAAELGGDALRALFDPRVDVVAAIVSLDDRTESMSRSVRYTLTINGVVQPGG